MAQIQYCKECHVYTLKSECPACKKPTIGSIPPKFSIQDKYAKYRRQTKYEE